MKITNINFIFLYKKYSNYYYNNIPFHTCPNIFDDKFIMNSIQIDGCLLKHGSENSKNNKKIIMTSNETEQRNLRGVELRNKIVGEFIDSL